MGTELLVEPVRLVLGDRQQAERADELEQVARGGRDGEQRAARREDARHLRRVARREDAQDQRGGTVAQRQVAPGVGADRGRARVGSGGAAERGVRTQSSASPMRLREGIEHAREVMPGPRADVHDTLPGASLPARLLGERLVLRPAEVAGGQERLARLDHLRAVARARHEVHVALARDVERVALAAAQDALALLERGPRRPGSGADRRPR